MNYQLVLKSGTDFPDFTSEIDASSKDEALNYFQRGLPGYDKSVLELNISCDKCVNTFNSRNCNHEPAKNYEYKG